MNKENTTWRKEITSAMQCNNGDNWQNKIHTTLSEEELDEQFYAGYGSPEGRPFTFWTRDWVYFPTVYDGAEGVSCVPRHPSDYVTGHVGGW